MVGLYRTGKSYLLNKMLLNKNQGGFQVGSTINACTKGLWIWPQVIKGKSKDNKDVNILIIDTEGIGSLEEDSNHDAKIFVLGILISSCFVYSSVGAIQSSSIENLSLVVYLTQMLGKQLGSKIQKPDFIWALRDFNLALRDDEGNSLTSNQYLEKVLCEQKGTSQSSLNRNKIKKCIKEFFVSRQCITFIRPLSSGQINNLMKIPFEKLQPQFVQTLLTTRNKLINQSEIKTFQNSPTDGKVLSLMIQNYTNAMNSNTIPNILSAWESINNQIQSQIILTNLQQSQKDLNKLQIPSSEQTLKSQIKAIKQKYSKNIQTLSKNSYQKFRKQFKKKSNLKINRNIQEAKQFIINYLNKKYKKVQQQKQKSYINQLEQSSNGNKNGVEFQELFGTFCKNVQEQLANKNLPKYIQILNEWKLNQYQTKYSYMYNALAKQIRSSQQKHNKIIKMYQQQSTKSTKEIKHIKEQYERDIIGLKNNILKLQYELSIKVEQINNSHHKSCHNLSHNCSILSQSNYTLPLSPVKPQSLFQSQNPQKNINQITKQLLCQISVLKQQLQFKDIKYSQLSIKLQQTKKSQSYYLSLISAVPKQPVFNNNILKQIDNQQNINLKEDIKVLESKYKSVYKQRCEKEEKVYLLQQQVGKLKEELEIEMNRGREKQESMEIDIQRLTQEIAKCQNSYRQQLLKNRQLLSKTQQLQYKLQQAIETSQTTTTLQSLKQIYEQQKLLTLKSIQQQKSKLQSKYRSKLQDQQRSYCSKISQLQQQNTNLQSQLYQKTTALQSQYQILLSNLQHTKQDLRNKQRLVMLLQKSKKQAEYQANTKQISYKLIKEQIITLKKQYEDERFKLKEQYQQMMKQREVRLKENVSRFEAKVVSLEEGYHSKQKEYLKIISQYQTNNISFYEKYNALEVKYKECQGKSQVQLREFQNRIKLIEKSNSDFLEERRELQGQLAELENEKEMMESNHQNDQLLWKNKMDFVEQQKESMKKHYLEKIKKLQDVIEFLNKNKDDKTYQKIVKQVSKKYQMFHEGKSNQQQIDRRWQQQIRQLKRDKQKLMIQYQKSLNSQKEVRNLKLKEMEERVKEAEYRRQTMMNQHEIQKNQWKKQRLGFMKMRKFIEGNSDY